MRDLLLRPLPLRRLAQGFLFLPLVISCTGAVTAVASYYLDSGGLGERWFGSSGFFEVDADGARSLLSTIAGASMTVLSLVYSMTLLVFTLAASSLGPRLLETFIDNRVNQITIGILGAVFLHSVIALFAAAPEATPSISAGVAVVMAIVGFFWVAYFVNDAAHRVMIDHQIGRTEKQLRRQIQAMLEAAEEGRPAAPVPEGEGRPVAARRSGYVTHIDVSRLIALAQEAEAFVELAVAPGDFVFEGLPLARVVAEEGRLEADALRAVFWIRNSRAPEGDLLFSIHLMVEIAVRALSPGINDVYTAIGAMDHLSASLNLFLERGEPSPLRLDEGGRPRLRLKVLTAGEVLDTALAPLRRAAQRNVEVTVRLALILERLAATSDADHLPALRHQLKLLSNAAQQSFTLAEDRRAVAAAVAGTRAAFAAAAADQAPTAAAGSC